MWSRGAYCGLVVNCCQYAFEAQQVLHRVPQRHTNNTPISWILYFSNIYCLKLKRKLEHCNGLAHFSLWVRQQLLMSHPLANEGYSYDNSMVNQRSLLGHDIARNPEKTPRFTSINKSTCWVVFILHTYIHNLLWRARRATTPQIKVVKTLRTNVSTLSFLLTLLRIFVMSKLYSFG